MSKKEHKIVVTRDGDGTVAVWAGKLNSKIKRSRYSHSWNHKPTTSVLTICNIERFKKVVGFLPRKGIKEMLTITRGKEN